MAGRGEERALRPVGVFRLVACRDQLGLQPLSIGHVADRAGDEQASRRLDRTQADLDGKLGAVAAQAEQLDARAHGPESRRREESLAVGGMGRAVPFGQKDLDRLADQLVSGVAEEAFGLLVDEHHPAGGIGDDHGVRSRVEQRKNVHVRNPHRGHLGLVMGRGRLGIAVSRRCSSRSTRDSEYR